MPAPIPDPADVTAFTDLAAVLGTGDPNDVVKAFAANQAFRAAEWEELTTEDDPYRRPVRPDDLEWLDYDKPLPAEKALKLSALLGHRMLRNVYDADRHFLPAVSSEASRNDAADFYSTRNRVLGALARPVLERHLFAPLAELATPTGTGVDAARAEVLAEYERRSAEPGAAFEAARATKHRAESANFVLLQIAAYRPAAAGAWGGLALGEYDEAHPGLRRIAVERYRRWVEQAPAWRSLLATADLRPGAAAYWQLWLGSSLGRGNHLQHLSRAPEHQVAALGALVHELLDQAVTDAPLSAVLAEGLGADLAPGADPFAVADVDGAALGRLVEEILTPLQAAFGDVVVDDFRAGFAQARWFAGLWDRDLADQVSWADRIEEYQEKAEKIDQHLSNENIEVDLDTFVESNEETSTTHVHNEHRLVMIERGQMHFWNNTTHKIELNEGDKLLIPVSRLHGSTVLSGECTYHQPIIPDEMLAQFL
ncbi:hypothetical protein LQ327_29970 [Actinomycetospora endophytica]|uniref:Peptide synthetase n=1 Tax=Actinomycetospora endophytica TaxID=2291215 RepID=A0ABS8PJL1_9PSEU|nr:hypothetical protein [Actinomycetospora endophytica]MCD2197606.1 hypothetical protein [Actinomycetospora endophytica]